MICTVVSQQSLRAARDFCDARLMSAPEAYFHFIPDVFGDVGTIQNTSTDEFLRNYMAEFRNHIRRVLTVLPR